MCAAPCYLWTEKLYKPNVFLISWRDNDQEGNLEIGPTHDQFTAFLYKFPQTLCYNPQCDILGHNSVQVPVTSTQRKSKLSLKKGDKLVHISTPPSNVRLSVKLVKDLETESEEPFVILSAKREKGKFCLLVPELRKEISH